MQKNFWKAPVLKNKVKIAPSILSADFSRLGEQVKAAEKAGGDYIHVDVMDGRFVPNITIGPPVVSAIRNSTRLPLDVHLMIDSPELYVRSFVEAGADIISVHIEACKHIHRTIESIKEAGIKAGVALNPGTPLESIFEIIPFVDLILVMTVNPGFGGQKFIPSMISKIERLRGILDEKNPAVELEVDGGINEKTARQTVKAGARVLVAGAAIFANGISVSEAVQRIRRSVARS
jgi:ribulose-phosphate 3-epimerase